jgi:aminopeptidase N
MRLRALLVSSLALVSCATEKPADVAPPPVTQQPVVQPPIVEAPPTAPPSAPTLVDDRLPALPTATEHAPAHWPFDVERYAIDVIVDPPRHAISGRVTIDVTDGADALDVLPLDAVGMTFDDVAQFGTAAAKAAYTYDGKTLRIPLGEPRRAGTKRRFEISYSATPTRGVYFNDGDPAQVYTQGEAEDSRYWFPCHDAPDDRATHDISVHVPPGWEVVSGGQSIAMTTTANGHPTGQHRFVVDVPHVAYLTSLVAGDYRVVEEQGVVPLQYVVEERDAPYAKDDFKKTDAVLRFFGEYTGLPYPYPKYAQTCVRNFMFGGMENISATTLTDHTIHPPEWESARSSTSLIAHEAAHQWFGDWITCADWSHCWLNEGFATYFDLLFTEHDEGRDMFLWRLRGERHGALGAMDHKRRAMISSTYVEPMDLFDGHAYAGGACRLHMLRHLLGDKTFKGAIRHYVKTCGLQCVTTDDFEKAVEDYSGQDLAWFFDQWFKKAGYPVLKVRWKWDEAKKAEIVTVEQTQKAEGGVPEAYRLPLDIDFSVLDTDPSSNDKSPGLPLKRLRRRFEVSKRIESFEVPLVEAARHVEPDPDTALLARFDLDRALNEQGQLAFDTTSPSWRVEASEALVAAMKDEKQAPLERENPRAVLVTLLHNPEWLQPSGRLPAFRAWLASQIAAVKDDRSAKELIAVLDSQDDLRVRLAAIEALAGYGENAAARATVAWRAARDAMTSHTTDSNELIQAAVVSAIAKLKPPNAFETLSAAVERPGFHSVIRVAALHGFADLGDERAFATLVRFAKSGEDFWARGPAIGSLGRMGKKKPAWRDAVLPYLDDNERGVRQTAADALAKIADPDTMATLVAHFHAETWPACREALRNAVRSCRAAAVEEGRLVSVESVRAADLRERHAALRDEAAALEESLKTLAGDEKTSAETRAKSLKDQMAQLQRDLGALGVAVKPPPKPPAK